MSFFRRPTDDSSDDSSSDDSPSNGSIVFSEDEDDDNSLEPTAADNASPKAPSVAIEPLDLSAFHAPSINAIANSIRKSERLSIANRLHSIHQDSQFVDSIATVLDLPLVANERCGSWYVPPHRKAGSCYFKSTDGHFGCWSFSTRRLNLGLLEIIGRTGGCIIVDSTRRGKALPDALSKTVPIWCAVMNAVLFPAHCPAGKVELPGSAVSASEEAQITARLDGWVSALREMELDVARLAGVLGKPVGPGWVTREGELGGHAARRRGEVASSGAGDDHEGWARGLLPVSYWQHQERLLQTPEAELPSVIDAIVAGGGTATVGDTAEGSIHGLSVLSKVHGRLAVCDLATYSALAEAHTAIAGAVVCSEGGAVCPGDASTAGQPPAYRAAIPSGKAGSKLLRAKLADIAAFSEAVIASGSKHPLVIACQSGNDVSIGIALALVCWLFNDQGQPDLTPSRNRRIDKTVVRQRLGWIISDRTQANPSRATLQAVNLFLMGWSSSSSSS
ncbi:hypothetical protein DRE_03026 [Drechslerella stenobrocha 248]|uniref:Initiator tRNA phosphoribosyl transferase n=1 Tax=Drechslerella stenobrocha 248 TaxID=1043628 RepID=W7HUD9_9PEZI|nr:hypothetical protein DRE_03026 [Drechslerella stenobrocha 248]